MSQNSQDKFFGIIITAKLMENRELSAAEKFIYAYISSYKSFCADSNGKIGDRLGFSERTVTRCLSHLAELGYLYISLAKNNNSLRRIYDIYEKPNRRAVLDRKSNKKIVQNREEVQEFSTGFAQNGVEPMSIDKMSRVHDKMSVQITDRVWTKCLPKNNKNKKKKENAEQKPNKVDHEKTPSGLAGGGPASRLVRHSKIMRLSELLSIGAD